MDAEQFRQARLALGLSTHQLANRFKIARRTIERIEHGEGPTLIMSMAMAELARIIESERL